MWQEKNNELYKEFSFKDFKEAFTFMQAVAVEAETRQHHPRWQNDWNNVQIWLNTHSAGNVITDKDRALAQAIDSIYRLRDQPPIAPSPIAANHKVIKLYTWTWTK